MAPLTPRGQTLAAQGPTAASPTRCSLGAGAGECNLRAGSLLSGDAGVLTGGATLSGPELAVRGHLGEFASAYSSSAP